jgi:hypothetical protein
MIKFFRRIRQQLLSKNKFSKYILYALGEILLVVIGILIALQINNRNEEKRDHAFEIRMLNEVKKALDNDIAYFKRMIDRYEKLDSSVTQFVRLIHQKASFNDTLYRNGSSRWYYLRTGNNYIYNRGPYEAIKSSGLDRISNDSLRNQLVNLYDFEFPRNKELMLWADRDYEDDTKQLESFLGPNFIEIVDGEEEILSKFPEDLLQRPRFLELLRNMRERARLYNMWVGMFIIKMEGMSQVLNRAIEE